MNPIMMMMIVTFVVTVTSSDSAS